MNYLRPAEKGILLKVFPLEELNGPGLCPPSTKGFEDV